MRDNSIAYLERRPRRHCDVQSTLIFDNERSSRFQLLSNLHQVIGITIRLHIAQ